MAAVFISSNQQEKWKAGSRGTRDLQKLEKQDENEKGFQQKITINEDNRYQHLDPECERLKLQLKVRPNDKRDLTQKTGLHRDGQVCKEQFTQKIITQLKPRQPGMAECWHQMEADSK
ncbi:hypothetical protein OXYTRIMIC_772 [Oxytricha trifallax]|uniref:Uncharacterized protein n=1 Tax=Oxytricha trifallax TaxID=1172189 RepID=A0A073HYX2_9SPIT|nr:hypothetical protein OXYTRIMIC_772 [Oxytricha trifallax]